MRPDSYRLATFAHPGHGARAGLVVDEALVDGPAAAGALSPGSQVAAAVSVLDLLRCWDESVPLLRRVAAEIRAGRLARYAVPLTSVRLLAPILYPGTVFCAGANYRDHVAEMCQALGLPVEPDPHELGLKPWHFLKAVAQCVRGPDSRVALPAHSKMVDWEAEIAVVIGRECRDVGVDEALRYVAGLTIVNDLSARDHLRREGVAVSSPFRFDWVGQKCFDGALPMGPWICPLDQIADHGNLGIQLWVNDELMQSSSSSNLIFSMAEQVAHLSARLTLLPGDVVATGTPAGCGAARGRYLKAGDRVRIRVEEIGELVTEFTA